MTHSAYTYLAVSSQGALWLIVAGVAVAALLIAAFVIGTRRAARRSGSTPVPGDATVRQAQKDLADPPRSGEGWSTPDADPEQGHPHS
ncbi:DUF6479 family protein [Streptomyces sp. NPDC002580]|uniref:DUF6479 family protein n=1 Tax=Streptomyces sp. NPDC002580 TaxID=3364653 RepID=UPI0036864AF0